MGGYASPVPTPAYISEAQMDAIVADVLSQVEEGQSYTHPATHPATMITEDTTHRFVTDAEKITWNSAEANVNVDWNASSGDAQILNKPTIPAAQIQSDWNQAGTGALDFIKNKPSIPVVSDTAYDASSWDNNTDAPTKNAVRDKFESLSTGSVPTAWGKYF